MIRFIGKSDKVSDLFGEKLNELFIKNVMDELGFKNAFYMVAPEGRGYVLYIKTAEDLPDIDALFCTNFHYAYCRKLGQLNPLRIYKLEGNCEQEYVEYCVKRGQRMGDVKLTVLSLVGGWDKVFAGRYIT